MNFLRNCIVLLTAFSLVLSLPACSGKIGSGADVPSLEGSIPNPTGSTVTTEPTDPNPTDSSLPAQTDPSLPVTTEPTQPTAPTKPIPTEPTNPSQPEASEPTQPTAPTTTPTSEPEEATEELNAMLDKILAKYGSSPRDIYDYVHDHFKYKYAREKSKVENALHLLEYGTGSCYHFASLTYFLFQRAGYEVYYVTGIGWQNNSYHCWVLAYFDGGWYYVDSLYVRSAKLTAEDLRRIGYSWDEDAYPS